MVNYFVLIERIGGAVGLAAALDISVESARLMRSRGRIPPRYWQKFRTSAAGDGLELERGDLEDAEIHYQQSRVQKAPPSKGKGVASGSVDTTKGVKNT